MAELDKPVKSWEIVQYVTKDQVLEILRKHYPYATLKEEHAMYKVIQEVKALPGVKINED